MPDPAKPIGSLTWALKSMMRMPSGVLSKLFRSDSFQSATSTFVENGTALSFAYRSSYLPNTGRIASNYISETTIDMSLASSSSYNVVIVDTQGNVLNSITVAAPTTPGMVWGLSNWGAPTKWGSTVSNIAPKKISWTEPIVTDQCYIQVNGQSAQGVRFGKIYLRYSVLGYLADQAA